MSEVTIAERVVTADKSSADAASGYVVSMIYRVDDLIGSRLFAEK